MQHKDILEAGLRNLVSLPHFLDFWETSSKKEEIEHLRGLLDLCDAFQGYLLSKEALSDDSRITIAIVREQIFKILFYREKSDIHAVDKSIKINDGWIKDFREELSKCITGNVLFEEVRPRKYKTIREMAKLEGVDGEKLSLVYEKYRSRNHPLANYYVGSILLNSRDFTNGLPILAEALKIAFVYPNYYWHNEDAVEGLGRSIGLLVELLSRHNYSRIGELIRGVDVKILEFHFLYASRYIYMTNSNLGSVDFYVHRADIQKTFYEYFIDIHPLGVNPDIQYISDYYLAHQVCLKNNFVSGIRDFFFKATTMYQNASHQVNWTKGYTEIEEKSLVECVSVGEIRSIQLANLIYQKFKNYELSITSREISKIMQYLSETHRDNPSEYIERFKINK